jgi:hypothetical protein
MNSRKIESKYKYGRRKSGKPKLKPGPKTSRKRRSRSQGFRISSKIIATISKSKRKQKKFQAVFIYPNGRKKTTHFGQKGASDYTKHKDDERKKRYITRHTKRENWGCKNFATAGFLSRWILWNKKTVKSSINNINRKCKNVKFIYK